MNELRKEYHNKTAGQIGEKARDLQTSYFTDEYVFWLEEQLKRLRIGGVSNCKIADDKLPTFDLTDIIQFGYYVRKNPNVVMRENYLNWKELPRDKPFSK